MKAKLLLLPLLIASGANADVLMPTENSAKYADNRVRLTAKLQEAPKLVTPKMTNSDVVKNNVVIPQVTSDANKNSSKVTQAISATEAKILAGEKTKRVATTTDDVSNAKTTTRTSSDLPLRELNEEIQISFRDRSLPSSIRTLTPPGWVVDLQIDKSIESTLISFSGETSYAQALKDILEPQGLTYLAYRNMKPKPLIVVTHGGKK